MKTKILIVFAVAMAFLPVAVAQEVHYGESFELNAPLNANQSHEYYANDYIDLGTGFLSTPKNHHYTILEPDPYHNNSTIYGLDSWFSPDHPLNTPAGKVGTIPMEFTVNDNGAATISIPLEFPEGINGMIPHISLEYNSQTGNGIMGLGWSLGGLSKISRVPYTYLYNDSCGAVLFSNQDELSLDGNRLRKGTDGIYYPELYDFSRIIVTNNGFVQHRKDGIVCEYKAPYYLQDGPGFLTSPIEWHISRMSDPYGNAVEFRYRNNRENGSFRPDTIKYTCHDGIDPAYQIVFSYSGTNNSPKKYFSSKDASNAYNTGYSMVSDLLTSIACYHNGRMVTEYVIDYTDVGVWSDKALWKVRKYGYGDSNSTCKMLSATVFEWSGTFPSLQYEKAGANLSFFSDNTNYTWQQNIMFPARFENSIYPNTEKHCVDIVHLQKAQENNQNYVLSIYRNGGAFANPSGDWSYYYSQYTCNVLNDILPNGREIFAFMPADTDGDGLNEIVCVHGNRNSDREITSVNVCLIRKTPNQNSFYTQPVNITTGQPDLFGDFAVMDFDGDGRSDLFCTYDNNMIIYPSVEGHPFYENMKITSGGTNPVLKNTRKIVIGDFYGNKKDQILVMNKNTDNTYHTMIFHGCHRPQQGGQGQFLPADAININLGEYYYQMNNQERNLHFNWGDFNGDGKKDALVMKSNRWLFFFSKGNGKFEDSLVFAQNDIVGDNFVTTTGINYNPMVHVADFDQDGCDDISVSVFRFVPNYGPNYNDWIYAGMCRRDFLIRPKNNHVEVRRIAKTDINGCDVMIDSIRWRRFDAINPPNPNNPGNPTQPIYATNAFLSCVGMHKGTSPTEIMYARLTENRGLVLHVAGSLDNPPTNLITKTIDGLGVTTEIQYCPHTFQVPFNGPLNGDVGESRPLLEKVIPFNGFLNVVQKVKTETKDAQGTSGKKFRLTRYYFSGAKYHTQGKGFIGFRNTVHRKQGETGQNDIQTTTIYNVDTNHGIMIPRSIINYRCRPNVPAVVYDSSFLQYTYIEDFNPVLGDIPTGGSGGVFCPYLSATVRVRNDGSPQKYEKTETVKDGYGNITSFKRRYGANTTNFPYLEITSTTYDNSVASDCWILGVPKSDTVTQRLTNVPSDQVVLYTSYQNDMTHGRHLSKITEPNSAKQLTESYSYDCFGNLDTLTSSITGGNPRRDIYTYSADGRFMTSHTNAKGHTSHYYHHDATGLLDSVTDPNGLTTRYHYDYLCNLVKTELPSGILEEQKMKWVDQDGLFSPRHPDTPDFGAPVYFVWSKRSGERSRYTFYDQHRRLLREVDSTMDGKKVYVDYRYHDVTGLLDSVSAPYYPEENETQLFSVYQYDYLDRNTMLTRPDGATMSHSFEGHQETLKGFDGQRRTLTYNPAGLVTKVSDYGISNSSPVEIDYVRYGDGKVKTSVVGNESATTITYIYDVNGNPSTVADPSLGQLTYDYNGFGELVYSATPRDTVTYTHDALGRMVTRNGLDGYSHWQYDAGFKGALSQTHHDPVSGPTVTESFAYDRLGNPTRHRQQVGADEEWTFIYGYDALGHRNAVTYPSGKRFKWHYDRNGFMDRVTDANSNTVVWEATATDRWNNTTEFTEGNIHVVYGYDPVTGLVTGISAHKNGQSLFGQACSWTTTGNLDWRTDTTLNLREEFTYDRFNRLTSSTISDLAGTLTNVSEVCQFDSHGNVMAKDGVGIYDYEHATNPYAVTGMSPDQLVVDHLADQYVAYTPFDKVDTIRQSGNTLTVRYDIDRQRVKQTFNDGKDTRTKRYFTPLYETETKNGVTKKLHYLTSATGIFAIFVTQNGGGGTMYYTLKDHQGSLAATIHGSAVERLSYDPWGRRRNTTNFGYDNVNHTFDRGYTLHEHYDEFDLINMNGRLYDPILGRMLSPDIVIQNEQSPQAYNRYSYCFNNPLRYTDPSGYVVDEWEIDAYGQIINHKKDKTQDVFYLVEKDENGNYVRVKDENGNYKSIAFEYGTIEKQKTISLASGTYDTYEARGDENGKSLFEFFAGIVRDQGIEVSHAKTGIEGDKGLNFITTAHLTPMFYYDENGVLHKTASEPGMAHLLENKLLYGYTIRELNHSHPLSSKVSSADERFAKQVKGIQKKSGYHIPKFYIYDVSNKKYIPYGL